MKIKSLTKFVLATLALGAVVVLPAQATALPNWDVSGNYVVGFVLGGTYLHDVNLVQDSSGDLTGSGSYPAGGSAEYSWHITSGSVSGDAINLTAVYDTGAPGVVMHMTGTIAADGSMSGNWDDNNGGSTRTGTWSTTEGTADKLGALAAEDFGVVHYDTGLGMLTGYTAGFGLTGATFANVQSVVVKLYSGTTLLQTNTATPKVGAEITGSQISSPFDVFGTFDYATDGYWTNVRESEYGRHLIPTKVVATVVLENGQQLTAENTNLTGDPASIFPQNPPVVSPTTKDQCKDGGWKTFTDPVFKNQGSCVSFVQGHHK